MSEGSGSASIDNARRDDQLNTHDMRFVTTFFGAIMIIGLLVLIGGAWSNGSAAWYSPLLWSIAIFMVAMATGFLFGVPKVLQRDAPPSPEPSESGEYNPPSDQNRYRQRVNTNLEEISDWLTKIIIGVGLIELKKIPGELTRLADRIAPAFGSLALESARSLSLAIVLFFGALGFLYGYLMTRLYLQGALARAESDLGKLRQDLNETYKVASAALNSTARRELTERRAAKASSTSEAVWLSDPLKGFAKGRSEQNHRKLSATVNPIPGVSGVHRVSLKVASTRPSDPLSSPVLFHLHPTFSPDVMEVSPKSGIAQIDILALECFTVGAVTDQGGTKLELDLAEVPGGNPSFYAD